MATAATSVRFIVAGVRVSQRPKVEVDSRAIVQDTNVNSITVMNSQRRDEREACPEPKLRMLSVRLHIGDERLTLPDANR